MGSFFLGSYHSSAFHILHLASVVPFGAKYHSGGPAGTMDTASPGCYHSSVSHILHLVVPEGAQLLVWSPLVHYNMQGVPPGPWALLPLIVTNTLHPIFSI